MSELDNPWHRLPGGPPFVLPEDIRAAWDQRETGSAAEKKWTRIFKRYKREFPKEGAEFVIPTMK